MRATDDVMLQIAATTRWLYSSNSVCSHISIKAIIGCERRADDCYQDDPEEGLVLTCVDQRLFQQLQRRTLFDFTLHNALNQRRVLVGLRHRLLNLDVDVLCRCWDGLVQDSRHCRTKEAVDKEIVLKILKIWLSKGA